MNNYSPFLPHGKNDEVKQNYPPAKIALVRTNNENANASSILLLGHNTTEIEVMGAGNPCVIGIAGKWLSQATVASSVAGTSVITAAGSTNFDFVVPGGVISKYVVTISTNPQTGSVQGINRELGLYRRVAIKSIGTASVLLAEF